MTQAITQLWIQPGGWGVPFGVGATLPAGQWERAIPTPGIGNVVITPGIPAIDGIADCKNLLKDSPPTLLERYELYSYSIAWGVWLESCSVAANAHATAELGILVNDRIAYTDESTVPIASAIGARAGGTFRSDLVNPVGLSARDRLSLRLGISFDEDLTGAVGGNLIALISVLPGGPNFVPQESTLSYYVIPQSPVRQLP